MIYLWTIWIANKISKYSLSQSPLISEYKMVNLRVNFKVIFTSIKEWFITVRTERLITFSNEDVMKTCREKSKSFIMENSPWFKLLFIKSNPHQNSEYCTRLRSQELSPMKHWRFHDKVIPTTSLKLPLNMLSVLVRLCKQKWSKRIINDNNSFRSPERTKTKWKRLLRKLHFYIFLCLYLLVITASTWEPCYRHRLWFFEKIFRHEAFGIRELLFKAFLLRFFRLRRLA